MIFKKGGKVTDDFFDDITKDYTDKPAEVRGPIKKVSCDFEPKYHFVTTNKNKFKDFSDKVGDIMDVDQIDVEIDESRDTDVVEVCRQKLQAAYELTRKTGLIIEDRGFYIDALNGFPATFVKFGLETIGIANMTRLLSNDRRCRFRYVIALLDQAHKVHIFASSEEGTVAETVRRGNDRGWGPLMDIFISPHFPSQTLSELDDDAWADYRQLFGAGNHFDRFREYILSCSGDRP